MKLRKIAGLVGLGVAAAGTAALLLARKKEYAEEKPCGEDPLDFTVPTPDCNCNNKDCNYADEKIQNTKEELDNLFNNKEDIEKTNLDNTNVEKVDIPVCDAETVMNDKPETAPESKDVAPTETEKETSVKDSTVDTVSDESHTEDKPSDDKPAE